VRHTGTTCPAEIAMSTHPFEPPDTPRSRPPRPPQVAAMAGLAVDIGGSMLVGQVVGVLYALQLHDQGYTDAQLRQQVPPLPHDGALYMTGLLACIGLSLLGGYVCARVARRGEWRPGIMMAGTSALFGLALDSLGGNLDDMSMLLAITGIACNLLGVKYGAEHNRRIEAASP